MATWIEGEVRRREGVRGESTDKNKRLRAQLAAFSISPFTYWLFELFVC